MDKGSLYLLLKNNHDKTIRKTSRFLNLILVLFLGLFVSSCSVVGGIFKTGMDFGIFITVAVIVLIIVLVLRIGRRKN
jgi:steroid 5-alpha reductase family enzyme